MAATVVIPAVAQDGDTSDKRVAFSNNYAANSWRQAMLKSWDELSQQVVADGVTSTLATYSNLNKSNSYVQRSFNLSSYRGKTVTVRFVGQEDSYLQTSFVIDDTSLTTS